MFRYIMLCSSWHRCMQHTSVPPIALFLLLINAIVVNIMKLFPQCVQATVLAGYLVHPNVAVITAKFSDIVTNCYCDQGCDRYKHFGSPNQIQNQIRLVL